ncbi:zinc-ribbon domain-containing protein [Falsiroseomonas sp. CW058]|uniref:zinc-ribbon domain-containing protein n=1 Tax=Falsiroseomonas sp. CW058 TaxID=3388664 RepID=UPI003D3239DE
MRIACPGCAAEYEVPDTLLASGPRMLRCARCGQSFEAGLPRAPDAAPAPPAGAAPAAETPPSGPAPPEPAPTPPATVEAEAARPPPSRGLREHHPIHPPLPQREERAEPSPKVALVGWAVSLAVLAAAIWGAVAFRAEIATAWPPAARLFLALGLG